MCRDIISFAGDEEIAGNKSISTYPYVLYVKGSRITKKFCKFFKTVSS